MSETTSDAPAGLTREGCEERQRALREHLRRRGLATALIADRRHVYYLTGYWCRAVFAAAALVESDGPTTLVVPLPPEDEPAAGDVRVYESNRLGTLVDDQPGAALRALADRLGRFRRVGCDGPVCPWLVPECEGIGDALLALRRRKMADEVALLRRAIAATEAAYRHASAALAEGVTEVELFAGMQAAAAADAGEVLGEFGNDFQIGATGSPPRRRPARAGEVAILDLSVTLRGYRSDMCRSFVVGGSPTDEQLEAHRRVLEVLRYVEETARPGVGCRRLYEEARAMLDGYRGWSFPHHLGHGTGLSAHEAPRLNPHWDDTLRPGDVFTAEPGLYGPELRAGLRVEEIYLVTESGPLRLTSFPTGLARPDGPEGAAAG
ncbi:MAG TPA: Xaa-Pro peptidase family protein [Gemmataceae bacterium]